MSVVVIDHETMALGVDAHVCEVQLGIGTLDSMKNATGHANYVHWRNAKAE